MSIGPSREESFRMLTDAALREEVAVLRYAVEFYARPRSYGSGEYAIFLDDCGVARAALRKAREVRGEALRPEGAGGVQVSLQFANGMEWLRQFVQVEEAEDE